jgi:predicted permease
MQLFLQDLRFAIRTMAKSPVLTAIIVLSLAIGIGANTAIFSVVNALLLRPLPYPEADRLAILWLRSPGINIPQDWPSPGQYIDIRTDNKSFSEMSISTGASGTLLGLEQPEQIEGLRTSSTLFKLLGAKPAMGRLLVPEDDTPGKEPVAILSHALWARLFHSDPNVLGKTIVLNGVGGGGGTSKNQFTVAGVLSPEFMLNQEVLPTVSSITRMEIFLPLPFGPEAVNRRGDENYNLLARLRPGVSMQQAQADVSVIASRIREKDKRDATFTISVVSLMDQVVGDVRRNVLVLLGSVSLVLLIACANVANLLLSRATGRQKELAIRTALGAGWRRLVSQLMTESMLLGLAGGAAGLLLAMWSLYIVRTVNPGNIPRIGEIGIDGNVLLFTFGVSLLTGLIFGAAPALRALAVDLNTTLKAGGRSAQSEGGLGSSRHRLRSLLVIGELALSLVLLIGAGLLIRSFIRLQSVSPGFNPDGVITMRMGASGRRFQSREEALPFHRELARRVASLPGIKAFGGVSALPFTSSVGWGSIQVEGFQPRPGQELQVDLRGATPDYFRAMEVPLREGRFFSDYDNEKGAQPVALVDEKFAQRFWPNGGAIGKHIGFGPKNQMTIVGVVGAVKQYGLEIEGRIVAYFPASNSRWVVVRTQTDPDAAAAAIAREIRNVDSTVPIYDVRSMADRMQDSLARQRFSMILLGAFAGFALILAMVGVYGVMSFMVTQCTHDIGVRIALGAQRNDIIALVVRQGMSLAGVGIVAGLAGAALLTQMMASLLFGVSAKDLFTFSTSAVLLALVALFACLIPARRATSVDPLIALREE